MKRVSDISHYLSAYTVPSFFTISENISLFLSLSQVKPKAWEYLINREHHLVWYNVFEAASTSSMYNFNLLAGYSPQFLKKTKDVPLQLARRKYSRPTVEMVNKRYGIRSMSTCELKFNSPEFCSCPMYTKNNLLLSATGSHQWLCIFHHRKAPVRKTC